MHLEQRARADAAGRLSSRLPFTETTGVSPTYPEDGPAPALRLDAASGVLTARSSACPARGTLGGPPGRGSGAGAPRPGSPRHGVRPRATTRDPGAAPTPRVLCCSRRDAGPQQSLLPARVGLGSGKEGGCALYRVAWGQPPLGPLLGLRAGLRSPLVRVGSHVQVAWGAQPALIWVLRPLSAPYTPRPPTQLR